MYGEYLRRARATGDARVHLMRALDGFRVLGARPWAEKAYGIPPEQIIGAISETKFGMIDGMPALTRLPKIDFVDDGKACGITFAKRGKRR